MFILKICLETMTEIWLLNMTFLMVSFWGLVMVLSHSNIIYSTWQRKMVKNVYQKAKDPFTWKRETNDSVKVMLKVAKKAPK